MDSSPLAILPIELIFRILDFLELYEYSRLLCTYLHAVTLVNRKLDNLKDRDELWSGFYLISDYRPLHELLPPWKSRTARYVGKERRRICQLRILEWEYARSLAPPEMNPASRTTTTPICNLLR
jgi:hypothetical protein